MVTLIGILQAKTHPGAPNFVSIEAGDEPETGYYIELRPPICTITSEKNWMLGHERISEVQLAMSEMQYEQLGQNLRGVVTIKGTLFEAFNGHHHTPVLIELQSFEGAEKRTNSPIIKHEKIVKPILKEAKPTKPIKPIKQKSVIKPPKKVQKSKLNKLIK